jgi:hypothetical protein
MASCKAEIDCLRLSMQHFNALLLPHPTVRATRQCAQQIYHTALPLSPTSSLLHNSCIQSVIDNQLSHVTAFSGAPSEWGLLLRTIDVRPRQLACIATSAQRIVAACEDIVNIYDAVTFVLRQSLHIPETVTKIQGSPDGSYTVFCTFPLRNHVGHPDWWAHPYLHRAIQDQRYRSFHDGGLHCVWLV